MAILGRNDIRLDEVGSELDGEFVAFQRVFWPQAGHSAVSHDERRITVERRRLAALLDRSGIGRHKTAMRISA